MIEALSRGKGKILGFKLSGTLHDADYQKFVPAIDAAIKQNGKVRILAWLHDFQGWDLGALWDDIKFSTTHCASVERIALVGESTWESWMSKICIPFTTATIQYFDASKLEDAWKWIEEK